MQLAFTHAAFALHMCQHACIHVAMEMMRHLTRCVQQCSSMHCLHHTPSGISAMSPCNMHDNWGTRKSPSRQRDVTESIGHMSYHFLCGSVCESGNNTSAADAVCFVVCQPSLTCGDDVKCSKALCSCQQCCMLNACCLLAGKFSLRGSVELQHALPACLHTA